MHHPLHPSPLLLLLFSLASAAPAPNPQFSLTIPSLSLPTGIGSLPTLSFPSLPTLSTPGLGSFPTGLGDLGSPTKRQDDDSSTDLLSELESLLSTFSLGDLTSLRGRSGDSGDSTGLASPVGSLKKRQDNSSSTDLLTELESLLSEFGLGNLPGELVLLLNKLGLGDLTSLLASLGSLKKGKREGPAKEVKPTPPLSIVPFPMTSFPSGIAYPSGKTNFTHPHLPPFPTAPVLPSFPHYSHPSGFPSFSHSSRPHPSNSSGSKPSSLGSLGDLGSLLGRDSSSSSFGSGGLISLLSGLSEGDTTTPATDASSTNAAAAASTSSSSSLGALTGLLGGLTSGSDTENDVLNNTGCKDVTIIFARGTTEEGNVGTLAGPPMFAALKNDVGADKVAVQGVDYAASVEGNVELGADGGPTMASLVTQALSQCPDTKVIISGYSQGAMVVHNAASSLNASDISGAVLFGDPFNGEAVGTVPSNLVLENCASGDELCHGVVVITAAHLSYGDDADVSASFIANITGLN